MAKRMVLRLLLLMVFVLPAAPAMAQVDGPRNAAITSPEEFFGHPIGEDYLLPNYTQLEAYWTILARESDRMELRSIGQTEEGREQWQAIITSPQNHGNLDHYREIATSLARARGVNAQQARQLAAEGKAVIWIDGGLHATEVVGAQQLMQLVYDMVSLQDAETLRFLDDIVLLATHANPDGMELVSNWYMRNEDPLQRSTGGVPVLYEKYAGHDNNRDFYMANLAETQNMNRVMYTEWFPQIVYNHHQTGPAGTVMFGPPFRDPMNHFLDPMLKTGLDQVGSAMHQRFIVEGKGGTTFRSGASYSTWWNGGLRTTPYFKNQIGLLTEIIGNPTPIEIPFLPTKQISQADLPLPIGPGIWHFRQSIDYSQTSNRAVLDYASRNREHLLFNIWRMGMNSIERGSTDSWTVYPFDVDSAIAEVGTRADPAAWESVMRDPSARDPRGFILPSDQADFQTARKFVNTLLMNGVEVQRATADFTVAGTRYPAGSFVVRGDQAFRPHVLDMFERQEHPNDFAFPGAPPTAPYDNAGWTLAWQMGVEFDRIMEGFNGPFQPINAFSIEATPAAIVGSGSRGFLVDPRINDAFVLVNRALAAGHSVHRLVDPIMVEGVEMPAGAFYFESDARGVLEVATRNTGVTVYAMQASPVGEAHELHPLRVGLLDQYGGSMPSGWTRFVLEQFEFPYEVVYGADLDAGNLNQRFDVLLFPDGAIPSQDRGGFGGRGGNDPASIPEEYRDRVTNVSVATSVPAILEFIRNGGTAITIGSSTSLGYHAGLPISDHMVDASGQPLGSEDYFTPGSVHEVGVHHGSPVTWGLGDRINIMHSHSPVFDVAPGASGVTVLATYDSAHPLRSGWAWGQERLQGGASMLEADVGQGKLFLFGPKVTFRGQSHGTFPLVFNGMYYGSATLTTLR